MTKWRSPVEQAERSGGAASPWQVRHAIHAGDLEAIEICGRFKVSDEAFDAWLKRQRFEPQGTKPSRAERVRTRVVESVDQVLRREASLGG